ncbi:hypothetical protein T492DRAFT_867794 [Pavlovales sp. CCMP2436]|nr:hypothetical protein T492DRAFT_867794 [Pavlovales sp. CCMP2436]
MVIFEGFTGGSYVNDVLSFSVRTRPQHECAGASPSPRYGHAACRVAESINRLVVFGGDLANSLDPALHCFDLQLRRWSGLAVGGEYPPARTFHAAILCGGGVLIFGGGLSGGERLNDTFLLRRRAGCTVPAALALAFNLVHTALSGTRRTAGALLAQEAAAESAGGRAMDIGELHFPVVCDWGAPRERPEMKSSQRLVARAWTPFFQQAPTQSGPGAT